MVQAVVVGGSGIVGRASVRELLSRDREEYCVLIAYSMQQEN